MAAFSGPKPIDNGLIFHHDASNSRKSWKGKPTTNLLTNPNFTNGATGYNAYVGSAPTTVIVNDFPGNRGRPKSVLQLTSASAPGGGGNSGGMSFSNPTLTVGLAYTISFWARILSHPTATNTWSNQSGSGDNSNFAFTKTLTNQWTYFTFTTTSLDAMKSTWYVWTNKNSATWQYADIQIEQHSFATPFVAGSRLDTESLADLTKRNTITTSSLTYSSDNTFSLNGSSDYILVPLTTIGSERNTFSIEMWCKINSSPASLIFNAKGQGLYPRITHSSNIIQVQYRPNGVTASLNSASNVALSTWTHVLFTYDSVAGGKLYINGSLSSSNTTTVGTHDGGTTGSMRIGNDTNLNYWGNGNMDVVKIYDKTLSAAEVAQSFNALRGRYGL